MSLLSRDEILNAQDKKTKRIPVPEWGGEVLIRSMSAAEKGAFEKKMISNTLDYTSIMSEYIAAITVDEDMKQLFTPGDISQLKEKSAAAIQRIFEAGQELNVFDANDIEDLAKN